MASRSVDKLNSKDSCEEREEGEEENDNIVIFQCNKCRRIIADSTAWMAVIHSLKLIVLHEVRDGAISVDDDCDMSKSGPDRGCTYSIMTCVGCGEVVGRIYRSTIKDYDAYRDCFAVEVAAVEIYTIDLSKSGKWKAKETSVETSLVSKLSIDLGLIQSKVDALCKRVHALEFALPQQQQQQQQQHPHHVRSGTLGRLTSLESPAAAAQAENTAPVVQLRTLTANRKRQRRALDSDAE